MGKSMIFDCPHCQQKIEIDDQWIGQKLQCPSCGNEIIIEKENPQESAEPAELSVISESIEADPPSGKKRKYGLKRLLLGLGILAGVAVLGIIVYFAIFIPHQKNTQLQRFKDNFAEQYRDTLRDPNSLMIDWKTSCMSDDGNKFWSIALIRAKNAMGGYADPVLMKIYGKKPLEQNSPYSFYQMTIKNHPFMHVKDITFKSFQEYENGQLKKMLQFMDRMIQKAVAEAQKNLALIVVPSKKTNQQIDFDYERLRLRGYLEAIYQSQLTIQLYYEKDPDYLFYNSVMTGEVPNLVKKLAELEMLGNDAKKRLDTVLSQISELERKQKLRRQEEERKLELRLKEERRQREWERHVASYENLKKKMVFEASYFFSQKHHFNKPNDMLVSRYQNLVSSLFPQIRRHYLQIYFLEQKFNTIPKEGKSESDMIRLTALRQALKEERGKYDDCLGKLLSGIHCSDPKCQCRKERLSLQVIPFDFSSSQYDDVMFRKGSKNERGQTSSETNTSRNRRVFRRRGR